MATQVNFSSLCSEAGIPATRRQRSKFAKNCGMAHHAKELRLVEKHNAYIDASNSVKYATTELKDLIPLRHGSFKYVRELISTLRDLRNVLKIRKQDYDYAKSRLPKFSPHVTAK